MLGRPQQREELTFCSKAQNITFRGASLLGRGSFYMEHGFIVLGSSERPLSVKSDMLELPNAANSGGSRKAPIAAQVSYFMATGNATSIW